MIEMGENKKRFWEQLTVNFFLGGTTPKSGLKIMMKSKLVLNKKDAIFVFTRLGFLDFQILKKIKLLTMIYNITICMVTMQAGSYIVPQHN